MEITNDDIEEFNDIKRDHNKIVNDKHNVKIGDIVKV